MHVCVCYHAIIVMILCACFNVQEVAKQNLHFSLFTFCLNDNIMYAISSFRVQGASTSGRSGELSSNHQAAGSSGRGSRTSTPMVWKSGEFLLLKSPQFSCDQIIFM